MYTLHASMLLPLRRHVSHITLAASRSASTNASPCSSTFSRMKSSRIWRYALVYINAIPSTSMVLMKPRDPRTIKELSPSNQSSFWEVTSTVGTPWIAADILLQMYYGIHIKADATGQIYYGRCITPDISCHMYYARYITAYIPILQQIYHGKYIL